MNINNVSAAIKSNVDGAYEMFGFSYDFSNGLNILTGDNSSGKSTVLSCIYYCLGLEQLIGSKGINALSPALHQKFTYKNSDYPVYESECSVSITANNKKEYTLTRKIKNGENTKFNEIEIDYQGDKIYKFIHSTRDHEEHGFYSWLASINDLDLFYVESFNGDSSKPLYMQNIFTLAFIEQTKGWSDYFSMMPTFGIKDPKQKVVEYCLDLNSLKSHIELDRIKKEKNIIKGEWLSLTKSMDLKSDTVGAFVSGFERTKPVTDGDIDKIYTSILNGNSKEVKIKEILDNLKSSLAESEKAVAEIEKSSIDSLVLVKKKDAIQSELNKYASERHEAFELYEEEVRKLAEYKKMLSHVVHDTKDFQDIRKVSEGKKWSKIGSTQCPVCDNNIVNKKDENLSEENIKDTLAFLKSQKSTYEKYVEACEKVIERYLDALSYYDKMIKSRRDQLDSIYKDMSSPSFMATRAQFEIQAEIKHRIIELNAYEESFSLFLNRLKELSKNFYSLDEAEKGIERNNIHDSEKILNLQNYFIRLLGLFGYRSNGVSNIKISDNYQFKFLPSVSIFKQDAQYIRFVSSASDFVRSIWAYYISLLVQGVRHPGFLIMDEPGQHQMRVDSMKQLLELSSNLDKQLIFAISQTHDYDSKNVNIFELLADIDKRKYKLHHIEDHEGCIAKI